MDFLKKILSNYIVRNLLIFIFICIVLFYGTLLVLRIYTHHGEALAVPDVRGLSVEDAGKLLGSRTMRWQLIDSVYITSAEPGSVVGQNPEPGSKVKENRNIFLIINATKPEEVKMPNVVGVSLRQAQSTLETAGLSIGKMSYIPDIAKNNVLQQQYKGKNITPGTKINKGSYIDLVLGRGLSDERTEVPNLIGLTLLDARDYLTKHSLNFGSMIYDNSVSTRADSLKAYIWQQKPLNTTLQLGASVDVWLTVDESKNPNIIRAEEDK